MAFPFLSLRRLMFVFVPLRRVLLMFRTGLHVLFSYVAVVLLARMRILLAFSLITLR